LHQRNSEWHNFLSDARMISSSSKTTNVNLSLLSLICILLTNCATNHSDSVRAAKEVNERTTLINREMSYFLIEAIDTRRFLLEAGMLATEQGTTDEIKHYGELMVNDQSIMIKEISAIAASRRIVLPEELSKEKLKKLVVLKEKRGIEFDKKFIKQFTTHHKYDLKEFEKATVSKDRYVRIFARRNLPVVQLHLAEIERIKDATPDTNANVLTVVSN
jgi:putative membrane protein